MAHSYGNTGMPVDTPILIRPGVTHKESDFHGNGKHYALPPEHPERSAKGDLGLSVIPGLETKPTDYPGLPFELKPKV